MIARIALVVCLVTAAVPSVAQVGFSTGMAFGGSSCDAEKRAIRELRAEVERLKGELKAAQAAR